MLVIKNIRKLKAETEGQSRQRTELRDGWGHNRGGGWGEEGRGVGLRGGGGRLALWSDKGRSCQWCIQNIVVSRMHMFTSPAATASSVRVSCTCYTPPSCQR